MKTRLWISLTMVLMLTLPLAGLAQPPFLGGDGPGFFGPDGPRGERGRGPGARGDHHGLRGLLPPPGYLDLSDEQIAAVQALVTELRAEMEPIREQGREVHSQLRDALESDSATAEQIGALVLEGKGLREQGKSILESYADRFSALLTEEQRVKWENFRELREQRRSGRHGDDETTP